MASGKLIVFGVLGLAAGVAAMTIPMSEHYSDDGYTNTGAVDVNCGSIASRKVDAHFADYEEQALWETNVGAESWADIFEGKTADQVCDGLAKDRMPLMAGAYGVGGVVLLAGLIVGNRRPAPVFVQPMRPPAAGPRPPSRSAAAGPLPASALPAPTTPSGAALASPTPLAAPPVPAPVGPAPAAPVPAPAAPVPAPPPASSWSLGVPASALAATTASGPQVADATTPSLAGWLSGPGQGPGPAVAAAAVLHFSDGRTMPVTGRIRIGRAPAGSDGVPTVAIDDPFLSATHVEVSILGGSVVVTDQSSLNGTRLVAPGVGEQVVEPLVPRPVPMGGRVWLGDAWFEVRPS